MKFSLRSIAALPGAVLASSALACASIAYQPRPPSEQRVASLDELARTPPALRMSAGGGLVLHLPLPDARGAWSVLPEPLEAVAIYGSVDGRGKGRSSRHEFDYRRLNPFEVEALESGKAFTLASTRWAREAERNIPLRLVYRVGKRQVGEFRTLLQVDRGVAVFLPPAPIVIEARPGEKSGVPLSQGREFHVRLPLRDGKGWRLALAEAELDPTRKGPLEMRDQGPREGVQEFTGQAQGQRVRLRFEPIAADGAAEAGAAIELELAVLPSPKC